jgi:hypothetical protein
MLVLPALGFVSIALYPFWHRDATLEQDVTDV